MNSGIDALPAAPWHPDGTLALLAALGGTPGTSGALALLAALQALSAALSAALQALLAALSAALQALLAALISNGTLSIRRAYIVTSESMIGNVCTLAYCRIPSASLKSQCMKRGKTSSRSTPTGTASMNRKGQSVAQYAAWAVDALFTGPGYVYDGRVLAALERVLTRRGELSDRP
jgi:hypothetical protein